MNIEELQKMKEDIIGRSGDTIKCMQKIIAESGRVATIAHYSADAISVIENEFESQTKLKKIDVVFLFFALALQCIRQYFLTDFKVRVDSVTAEKGVKKLKPVKYFPTSYSPYRATLAEVINGPVPFDVIAGSKENGAGFSGRNHRQKTLGHDPILGWIFGTSNIVTNTVTSWKNKATDALPILDEDFPLPTRNIFSPTIGNDIPLLQSYHVAKRNFGAGYQNRIISKANTFSVLDHAKHRLIDEDIKGKTVFGCALLQEYIHLKSDINSFKSLPIPIIHGINPELAQKMADFGIDTGSMINVGKQAAYATLINTLIGMIHYLCYDKEKDGTRSVYSVRTNKLITISNVIASASNALVVLFGSIFGNKDIIRKLDVGGFIVTLRRLLHDEQLQSIIKAEFIANNFSKLING
jgi:hypothetical protein